MSLGAGALCRLLTESPQRFERLVFILPAVLDVPRSAAARERFLALLDAVASGDVGAVATQLVAEVPKTFRNAATGWAYVRQRLDSLMRDGLSEELGALADQVAIDDREALRHVDAPTLIIACQGDELHPVSIAEELAEVLPAATLHVYSRPTILWTERADLRERVSAFLNQ
jgi:pimeloyl-ACP methyl ester carboxylesterase